MILTLALRNCITNGWAPPNRAPKTEQATCPILIGRNSEAVGSGLADSRAAQDGVGGRPGAQPLATPSLQPRLKDDFAAVAGALEFPRVLYMVYREPVGDELIEERCGAP